MIVGGCGHVGLPLGLVLADAGLSVTLYDVNPDAVDLVRAGKMPFSERDADPMLERLIATDLLDATTDPNSVTEAEHVVRRRRHAGRRAPQPRPEVRAHGDRGAARRSSATASTSCCAAPCTRGVTAMVEKLLKRARRAIDVSFCPERIAEGKALEELRTLPQIVSGRTDARSRAAEALFGGSRRRSSASTSKRPSSPSSSRTRGATSSSRPRTSSS